MPPGSTSDIVAAAVRGEGREFLRLRRVERVAAGQHRSAPAAAPARRASARPSVTGWLATIRSMPSSRVNAANCSVAPARLPSAVITSGIVPARTRRVASRATVSVLPAPGGPDSSSGGSIRQPAAGCRTTGSRPARRPACRPASSDAGAAARRGIAARRGGPDPAAAGAGGPSGSRAAVISTPPATRRVPRISASGPSSARSCAMAAAIAAARKSFRRIGCVALRGASRGHTAGRADADSAPLWEGCDQLRTASARTPLPTPPTRGTGSFLPVQPSYTGPPNERLSGGTTDAHEIGTNGAGRCDDEWSPLGRRANHIVPTVRIRARGEISACASTGVFGRIRSTIARTCGRMPPLVSNTGVSPVAAAVSNAARKRLHEGLQLRWRHRELAFLGRTGQRFGERGLPFGRQGDQRDVAVRAGMAVADLPRQARRAHGATIAGMARVGAAARLLDAFQDGCQVADRDTLGQQRLQHALHAAHA